MTNRYVVEKTQIGYGDRAKFEFNLYAIPAVGHKTLIKKL